MKKYGVNELRKMFLEFFEEKGHLVMKSFSLVPHNDKSLLLINSGMAPLKPYFTGAEIPPRRRVTTCQKCIRTGDIENVGKTARHGTFFEMLGNFSFGDYFKREAIHWSWEFLTRVAGLDPDRLYPSVYVDDQEAYDIWNKEVGISEDRIYRFGKEDNFWEHGAGPCGPCSEIYYDRGEKYGCGKPDCKVGCDCDRYMEIWNNVFTQFENDGNGNYTGLSQKNIDTGMGLERLASVVQDVDSIFDIDTVKALRDNVCALSGTEYGKSEEADVSIRLITDHIRSATFMISDGIMPGNEGRGYVLRRLIRRAARHGRLLGIHGKFLAKLCQTVIEGSEDGYPELDQKKDFIYKVLTQEEDKFETTIDQGLNILESLEEEMKKNKESMLSGKDAFKLYDTYGFPLDLTKEILSESGFTLDDEGFALCMENQRRMARAAREVTNYMGADATVYDAIDPLVTSTFVGYDTLSCDSSITVITGETEIKEAISDGEYGTIFTAETPFYATMGGQQGDKGIIRTADAEFAVSDTIKLRGGKIGHVGRVTKGMFKTGDAAELLVMAKGRSDTCKNHSATHLLQKALRTVLGTHVEQKGSLVTPDRLRFDFAHFAPMTKEELIRTEDIVNEKIEESLPVVTQVMDLESAKASGAMALFGEKYEEKVRVVSMGDFSRELCGGTHVTNTGEIRLFKIISETGVAAGVRRIEALTGDGVTAYYKKAEENLNLAALAAKSTPNALAEKIVHMQAEIKNLKSEIDSLKSKNANEAIKDIEKSIQDVNGVRMIASLVEGADMKGLRELGDRLKDAIGEGVIVLASPDAGKVSLIAMATAGAISKGVHAGNLIHGIAGLVGGGGGGRPDMAQAGGKNPGGIKDALNKAREILEEQIK